jgi:toxin-antitoxin system PIN domain toxin
LSVLLDVNVLIALVDGQHINHEAAHDWFGANAQHGWRTCPLTENGLVRIISHSKYPNGVVSPAFGLDLLRRLTALPGHGFWPDDVSLGDSSLFDTQHLLTSSQITDAYLLGLAVKNGGRLATFDRRLSSSPVRAGQKALMVLST